MSRARSVSVWRRHLPDRQQPLPGSQQPQVVARLHAVTRRHGRRTVLRDVDLTVRRGETVGLLGLNGAGKTTLLHTLLGRLVPDHGTALLNGLPASNPASRREAIFIPERFSPDSSVPVARWAAHLQRLCGVARNRDALVRECRALGVEADTLDQPMSRMSKGEAQKAGLAVSFLTERRFIVYDEPMSGLDPRARQLFRDRLLRLREERPDTTVLFSTHLLSDVATLCERIVIIHRGLIRFDGSPATCLRVFERSDLEQAFLCCIAQ